jgi:tetratricopeptide (TPR) repeat protein
MANRLESLLELHKKDSKDSFVIYGIALEYVSKKNFSEAEKYFGKLLKQNPEYVPAYMQFGILKSNLNKKEEAIKIFNDGITIANKIGDKHAANEMEELLNELR